MARTLASTMRLWPAILCVVLLAVAGCGGEEAAAPSGGGGGDGKLAGPITFKVTGGDAFRQDRITVRPDGSAQVTTRQGDKPAQLTDDELSELSDQVDVVADVPENSTTEPAIPDALSYSVEYQGRKVETDSGSLPEDLKPLIGTFAQLVDRYGTK